jgi:hypothetical protein
MHVFPDFNPDGIAIPPSSSTASRPVCMSLPSHSSREPGFAVIPQTPLRPQTRKITIKNLKSTPDSVPAAYFQQTALKLQQAVSAILLEGTLGDSLEELYRGVENLVRENRGHELYQMLQNSCRAFVANDLLLSIKAGISSLDAGTRAVECIDEAWAKWTSKLV